MTPQIVPIPNLIGRAAECGLILHQLHVPGQRLITLVGPGGIGKTSLALQIAASLAASADSLFADGVAIVPLAPVAKAADAALAIAEAAGVAPQGARPMADQLIG